MVSGRSLHMDGRLSIAGSGNSFYDLPESILLFRLQRHFKTRYFTIFTFPVTFRYLWSSLKQRRGRDWTNGQEQGRRLRWQDFRPLLRKSGIPPGKQKLDPGQQNPD